jgi:hypothetical protein
MPSDDKITKLERDLRQTRIAVLVLAVAMLVAIVWMRRARPSEIVVGDVTIGPSGLTIQPQEAPDVRVELSAHGLSVGGPHYSASFQSSNLMMSGEHGTTTIAPGNVVIEDKFGTSILTGGHWQAVATGAKGANLSVQVFDTGGTLAIGTSETGIQLHTGPVSTTLSGQNGSAEWMLIAGANPVIHVTNGTTTANVAPPAK